MGGSSEEAGETNVALAAVFPLMMALMLIIIMLQVRAFPATAIVLIGGTAIGTVLILLFLPALYAIWFRVQVPSAVGAEETPIVSTLLHSALPH